MLAHCNHCRAPKNGGWGSGEKCGKLAEKIRLLHQVVALLHVRENAAAPVGAGAWHGQKWSPEAKNEQACCQQGPLDGRTEAGPTEQNNIMRSHGTFLHFAV